jgi:hypothetical protein
MPFETKAGPNEIIVASRNGYAAELGGDRGKAFAKRVDDTFIEPLDKLHDRRTEIRRSGTFTAAGQVKALGALYRETVAKFKDARAKIAENLNVAITTRRADARAITTETNDPNQQTIRMNRIGRIDAHLRTLDRIDLNLRMRLALEDPTATTTALLADTIREAELIGLPIVDRDVASKFLADLQERADPEIAAIAKQRDAYDAIGQQAVNEIRRLADEDRIDLSRE